MVKVAIVVSIILCFVAAISMVKGNVEGFKEAEDWFQKLGQAKEKVTKLQFYFHDGIKTWASVALPKNSSTSFFGLMNVIDDPLTLGPQPTSKEVGRAQGFYAAVDQQVLGLTMSMNLVFTYGKYNGSTLLVSGSNHVFQKHRELPIIGGSGYFRLARGIATLTTYLFDTKSGDAIVQYDVMVSHY